MIPFRVLDGLPPYGPAAISFPEKFGLRGQEGLVVEFGDDDRWVGNFACGSSGITSVHQHPDQEHVVVFAAGESWIVAPALRKAVPLGIPVSNIWLYQGDLILECQELAFCRLDRKGIRWHTRRLSWDGIRHVTLEQGVLKAEVWALGDCWLGCSVELATGRSEGGAFDHADDFGWEKLADEQL